MDKDEIVQANQTPPIQLLSSQLEKRHAELLQIAAALETRLQSVMSEPVPTNSPLRPTLRADSATAQSQLAAVFNQRLAETESIVTILSSILRRLEV